jgi:hypothetical protein
MCPVETINTQELEKQFKYYVEHQDEIVAEYDGKVVVLVGETVVGSFADNTAAFHFAMANYEPGNFMIQLVGPGEENYTQRFFSRVAF